MELASNLVWGLISLALMGGLLGAFRRGTLRTSGRKSFLLVALACLLLLPVISISDDLLASRQGTLPASAQTWHLASNDAATAVEIFPVVLSLILFALMFVAGTVIIRDSVRHHAISAWLMRSQRLRPPPALSL